MTWVYLTLNNKNASLTAEKYPNVINLFPIPTVQI